MIKLEQTKIADYILNKWSDKPIWDSFDKIRTFITSRGDLLNKFENVLAFPTSQKAGLIDWITTEFKTTPKRLTTLPPDEQEKYRAILDEYFAVYSQLINHISTPDEWKSLLERAIYCPSENNVFCADDKIVLTCWGSRPQGTTEDSVLHVKVKNKKTSFRDYITPVEQDELTEDVAENISQENELPDNPIDDVPFAEEVPDQKDFLSENETTREDHKSIEKITEKSHYHNIEDSVPDGITKPIDDNLDEVNEPIYIQIPSEPIHDSEPIKEETVNVVNKEKTKNRLFRKKPWIWLLLLLLLFLLLFLLFRTCSGGGGQTPSKPGKFIPIDPGDIGMSDDSLSMVVTNRLNVLIKDKGKVQEFIKDFEKEFPNDKYKIIYYDTLVQRVQVQLPAEDKENFRNELPNRLPNYNILVWDESIYIGDAKPNDPAFNDDENSWYFECIKAYEGWNKTTGSDSIIVAILDNGFDIKHPELNGKIADTYNSVNRSKKVVYSSSSSGGVHGTHVAATAIGIANNSLGASGIAPSCKLMAIQVADQNGNMTTTTIMDGILYAIFQGADVVNLSLGKQLSPFIQMLDVGTQMSIIETWGKEEEAVWNEIFALAEERHCTVVLAGGNENILIGLDPMQRSSYTIKVSAVQPDIQKADFSNYGYYSTISAPGVHIYNAVPGGKYEALDGTSMAAPIVSGAVALIKSVQPKLTTGQIAQLLRNTGLQSPSNVGPVVQLDKALGVVSNTPINDIPDPNYGQSPTTPLEPGVPNYPGGPTAPNDSTNLTFPILPKPGMPDSPCPDIQKEIDKLQRRIDELRQQCGGLAADTLKLPENSSPQDITGIWKSTSVLYASDGEQVEVFFEINNDGSGAIQYKEKNGNLFTAPAKVAISDNSLSIRQLSEARSSNSRDAYNIHYYECVADPITRVAQGKGYSANRPNIVLVKFNLIKIK